MKQEAQALQTPPSSDSGCGPQKKSKVAEQVESPSIKLEIGIGVPVIEQEMRHLSAEQQDEYQRQVLIYEYIANGLPVPLALVRPLWESADDSLRILNGVNVIHRRYPSFMGISKDFDHRNTMDPEPDRCRRTDGKKWRCKKNVVPGQKYCEQHMHRGRSRSRKPVESFQTSSATPMNKQSKNLEISNTRSFYSASATFPSDTSIYHKNSGATSSSSSSNVNFKIMGANMTPRVVSCAKSTSTSMIQKGTLSLINAPAIMTTCTVRTDSTVTTAIIGADKGGNNNYYRNSSIDDRKANCSKYVGFNNQVEQVNRYLNVKNTDVSKKLNFSPKSVLRVQGGNSGCLPRSGGEPEPRRCRRTDGKKWQCRRDALPAEKYCEMHMHRGAKKHVLPHWSPTFTQAAPYSATSSGLKPNVVLSSNVDSSNLNTNLSISITANPQLQTKDDANTSGDGNTTISSSSDTISDTIIANCDYRDVSS